MKALVPTLVIALATSTAFVSAQEKSGRKSMVFQPGAKAPDVVVAAAPVTAAAPEAGGDEPAQIAASFFGLLQKNRVEEAYANLTKGSKIAERPEELKSLKTKTSEAIEMFGAIQGYDLVENKSVGAHLIRRTYLSLGRDFPLRWRFYFYRSDNVWRLVDLRVDDRLTGIFEEKDEAADSSSSTTKP